MASYREVKCPWCDHVFMWMEEAKDGIHYERVNEQGKCIGRRAECPKCYGDVAVMDGKYEGIPEEDLGPEIKTIREYAI